MLNFNTSNKRKRYYVRGKDFKGFTFGYEQEGGSRVFLKGGSLYWLETTVLKYGVITAVIHCISGVIRFVV